MPEEKNAITGGCFCGLVQFELDGPVAPATRCHCSQCRKRFGGTGSAMSAVGPDTFRWRSGEDQLTRYGKDYGLGFCSQCGSTLVGFKGRDVIGVTLSSLDGDPPVGIAQHIFVGSKACWDVIGDDAPQHAEWPDRPNAEP